MNGALSVLGVLLILIAIPFGLMLAPLAIGVIILIVVVRRADRALNATTLAGAR